MKYTHPNARRKFLRTAAVVAGSLFSWPLMRSTARAAKPAHTLVFGHTFTQATENYIVTGIDLFKKLAEQYSEGKLLVDVHEGGKLGGQGVLPQKVISGAIQGCQLSTQNFTPFGEVYNVLDFPFLFPTNESLERLLEDASTQKTALITEPASKGLKVLVGMWSNSGYRVLCTSKRAAREIRQPADLKGIKIRVTSSKIEQQSFALTPASPVSVDWAETYQAMQQGTVDGLNVGLGPLTATRIHETLATATKLNMSFNAHVSVVNKRWFEGLPSSVQEAIDRAARDSWEYQKTEQRKANERMLAEWKSMGIKIIDLTPEERSKWVGAVGYQRKEWDAWRERVGRKLYEHVLKFAQA